MKPRPICIICIAVAAPVCSALISSEHLPYLSFPLKRDIQVDISTVGHNHGHTWHGKELRADVPTPWGATARKLWLLPGFLRKASRKLLTYARSTTPSLELDSVDGLPAHEVHILQRGQAVGAAPVTAIVARVEAYVRQEFDCKECVACGGLLRRYEADKEDSRHDHPVHFDTEAFLTVVVGLNPSQFQGGLFVQEGEDVASRRYIKLEVGDVVIHRYDVRHGVRVLSGVRYSAIFWIKDSAASCESGASPWYLAPALAGDPDAQVNVARMHRLGSAGFQRNLLEAMRWYRLAADQGHPLAEYFVARLLHEELLVTGRDASGALVWARRAAGHGHAGAQALLGALLEEGGGGGAEEALGWYRRAANQAHPWGMYSIARLQLQGGGGLEQDASAGMDWLKRSARAGYKPARQLLDTLLEQARPGRADGYGEEL